MSGLFRHKGKKAPNCLVVWKDFIQKAAHLAGRCAAIDYLLRRLLDLDLNLDTAGELELHQSVDGLSGRAVDVDEALVVAQLELLTGLLVNEG